MKRATTIASRVVLLKGAAWTTTAFGAAQILRLVTNVLLARLLAPELFGIMQIVVSLRTGVELISDVGIGQNIIYNEHANDPDFYNTAWTLQVGRSFILSLVFCLAAFPIANFYQIKILAYVMPATSIAFVLVGLMSTSRFLLQKRLRYNSLTLFETSVAVISSVAHVTFAYISPTIWALVLAGLVGPAAAATLSHFLLKDVRQRVFFSKDYALQILAFGKWIFASSIVYFLATNFDRLYLAKTVPIKYLGIYGIAKALSEPISLLVQRIGNNVVFPFIASHSHVGRSELHAQLAPVRLKFLALASVGFALFAATADILIHFLYDSRYQAASWMLPILIVGAWFGIVSNINESTLMGLGRPKYAVFASSSKVVFLVIGLIWAVPNYGIVGGIVVVATSDVGRYLSLLVGQIRENFSFGLQDLAGTLGMFLFIVVVEWLRWVLGFGTSFDAFLAAFNAMSATVQ